MHRLRANGLRRLALSFAAHARLAFWYHDDGTMADADAARLLRDALDALNEGVQIVSPEWRYLYLNAAAARQGRKPREALLGKTMQESFPGIDKTPMFAVLARCMRDRKPETFDSEFEFEDRSRASFELRVQPCPAGIVILSVDMTARRASQEKVEETYRQVLRDLVTPVIRVYRGVLLVPIVGALDASRAEHMSQTLLARVADDSAKVVILDVSGLPDVDTAVASHLIQMTSMVRLLGAETILTGISAAVAKAIAQLGVDLSTMRTTTRLASGLEMALQAVGRAIVER